jgi:hypothetical protein
MKRVPGPVHAVAVTSWQESRARPWTTALSTAQGYGQPLRGSAVAHRLPTSFAFGLTRRCASCPIDTHHRCFPHHRYTLPIYNGSTRFALPISGCFRLIPELEKTRLGGAWLGCIQRFVIVHSRTKAIRRDNVLVLGSSRTIRLPDRLALVFIGGYLLRHRARTTDKFLLDHMSAPLRTFRFLGQLEA